MEIIPPTISTQVSLNLDTQNQAAQQQITRLPMSTMLMGLVAGNDKNGNLIIKLAGNDLILSSPLALSKNAHLALKLENVSGTITAQILSVDGKLPPTQPQAVSNQLQNPTQQGEKQDGLQMKLLSVLSAGTARVANPLPQATPQPVVITDTVTLTSPQTNVLKAMVITSPPEIAQALRANMSLASPLDGGTLKRLMIPDEIKPGTQLNLKIMSQTPPPSQQEEIQTQNRALGKQDWMTKEQQQQQTPQPQTQPQKGQPLATQQPAQQAQLPQATAAKPADVQMIQKQLLEFIPTSRPLSNGNMQLNGLVLDVKPNGELLVETRVGKVIVDAGQQGATIAKGTTLKLELTQIIAGKALMALPQEELPINQLAKDWPALKGLTQQASELGHINLTNKLAGIDSIFASRMAGFINAVRNDNLKDWLGANAYDDLESDTEGSALLGKLRGDFGTLRETFNQPNSNNWQTMLFPVFDGRELHQARLHVKYLPDEDQKPDPKAGTRFLVELDTSYFGEIQFDGLVHNTLPKKHFDLVMRSHTPMDDEMKSEIRTIFNTASEITGFKGDIEFTTMKEFPVNIFNDMVEQNRRSQIDHKGIEA